MSGGRTILSAIAIGASLAFQTGLAEKVDFTQSPYKEAIAKVETMTVEREENTPVLKVRVSNPETENGRVFFPLDVARFQGSRILFECEVKFSGVSRPAQYFNGVKFMAKVTPREGRISWPQHFFWHRVDQAYPDSDGWQKVSFSVAANDLEKLNLALGLEGSSGTAWFRNVEIWQEPGVKSIFEQEKIPQAQYTRTFPRMRGVMSPQWDSSEEVQEKYFQDLVALGGKLLRLQLKVAWKDQGKLMNDDYHDRWINTREPLIKTVLDYAEKYQLKVVVDLHYACEYYLSKPANWQKLADDWRKLAPAVKGHPALWGYDLLNEPHSRYLGHGVPNWPEIAEHAIRALREVDPQTPIIVEPDHMAAPEMLPYLPVFPYVNIFYSIHFYHPFPLTHQWNLGGKIEGYPAPLKNWNKAGLETWLAPTRKFQEATGAIIFVGEFGGVRWAPGMEQYYRDSIELFEKYQWHWCFHAFRESDAFDAEIIDTAPKRIWSEKERSQARGENPRLDVLKKAFLKNNP